MESLLLSVISVSGSVTQLFSCCISVSAFRYPSSRPCLPLSKARNSNTALPYSEFLSISIISEGLLRLPTPSVAPRSSYGVTSNTLQMIRIFSLTGFVFFLFQSLMLLWAIPVFSENSFWLIPRFSSSSNILSDIVISHPLLSTSSNTNYL